MESNNATETQRIAVTGNEITDGAGNCANCSVGASVGRSLDTFNTTRIQSCIAATAANYIEHYGPVAVDDISKMVNYRPAS